MNTETAREDIANAAQIVSGALCTMARNEFFAPEDHQWYRDLLLSIGRRLEDALRKMGEAAHGATPHDCEQHGHVACKVCDSEYCRYCGRPGWDDGGTYRL